MRYGQHEVKLELWHVAQFHYCMLLTFTNHTLCSLWPWRFPFFLQSAKKALEQLLLPENISCLDNKSETSTLQFFLEKQFII